MHRGRRKFFRDVHLLGRRFPRAAFVPTEWKLQNHCLNVHCCYTSKYLHHKQTQLRVINPLINSTTAEWNYCRSLIDKSSWTLQFCAVLINKLTFVPLCTQDGTGSGQSFGRACPRLWLKDLLSSFPCCTTTFGYRVASSLMIFL